jgi:hypothetical protein
MFEQNSQAIAGLLDYVVRPKIAWLRQAAEGTKESATHDVGTPAVHMFFWRFRKEIVTGKMNAFVSALSPFCCRSKGESPYSGIVVNRP